MRKRDLEMEADQYVRARDIEAELEDLIAAREADAEPGAWADTGHLDQD